MKLMSCFVSLVFLGVCCTAQYLQLTVCVQYILYSVRMVICAVSEQVLVNNAQFIYVHYGIVFALCLQN